MYMLVNSVSPCQVTTCDVVERALKKGKGAEIEAVTILSQSEAAIIITDQSQASRLAVLLSLQLQDPESVYKELRSVLVTMLQDKTVTVNQSEDSIITNQKPPFILLTNQ